MLTWRITYLSGGQRRITFFGHAPTGKRLTLRAPQPRATNNSVLTNSPSGRTSKAAGAHEESQTLPSLKSVPARNRERAKYL